MSISTTTTDYSDGDRTFEAFIAWDDSNEQPRPAVLVAHAWRGRSPFENDKACRLAELGYVGFALDVYGKGVLGNSPEENASLMQPLLDDREALQRRMALALAEVRARPEVDANRVAAIGFCFGGLSVLDLARSGADIRGVVSFHGLFGAPGNTEGNRISAKVLALHGWDDPMATPDQVLSLASELSSMGADWQIHGYGRTLHAFTNPEADDPANGLQYSAHADRRSWRAMTDFLDEVFA
ncbi:MAG: dienelactone hydrolase family protein [Gammaproteobacteria bacterium]|nr:dienelactone hydrolase family protein [Gammaproteobacteria bacterium]